MVSIAAYSILFFSGFLIKTPGTLLSLYNSKTISKYAKIKGPRITPKIPKTKSPPIIPRRTIPEWTFVLFATNIGLNTFSISEDIIPNMAIPIAGIKKPDTIK